MIKFWQALILIAVAAAAGWFVRDWTYVLPPVPPSVHHEDTASAHIDNIVPKPAGPLSNVTPKRKIVTVHDTTYVDTSKCHHFVPEYAEGTIDTTVNGVVMKLDILWPSWEHPLGLLKSADAQCPPSTIDTVYVPQIIRETTGLGFWETTGLCAAAVGVGYIIHDIIVKPQ